LKSGIELIYWLLYNNEESQAATCDSDSRCKVRRLHREWKR